MLELFGVILLLAAVVVPFGVVIWLISKEKTALPWVIFAGLCFPLCLLVLCIRRWGWLRSILWTLGGIVLWLLLFVGGLLLADPGIVYETQSLDDYRRVFGNYDNERPQALIDSFFPEEIGTDFVNPTWYYKAKRLDSIACEAWLEFTLPDDDAFDAHYAGLTVHGQPQPCPFDARYEMWVIAGDMDTWTHADYNASAPETDYRNIESATVALILCCREEQRFVYYAMQVYDGGGTRTTDLDYIFTRFNISPLAFEAAVCK